MRLGPYEIVAPIGAGGMGEVYRAGDPRLDRTVAVKVLPGAFAADSESRHRLEQEARAIAALNDPHICTIHDVGRHDELDYLVLEFLEGETLDARLARAPLPVEQALRYAVQICDALDAAHRRGLTHRDLKPANVMLSSSGVKLLDFGLAKPQTPVVSAGGETVAVPVAATQGAKPLTTAGTILGTIQYMAPEQIEGREADARTDIWAFGCVLHEMLTGTRAFEASTPASLIAAILEREPAHLRTEGTALPPRLADIIRTCLEKNPDDRWQSARDLARELRWLAAPTQASVAVETPRMAAKPVSRRTWLLAGAALAASIVIGGLLYSQRADAPNAPLGPPVIVLMDSTHPERIYDEQTRKAGGTNADDLTDVLRDLPVRLVKENTNRSWHREYEVLQENPALIVAHRSCFYDATILGEASRQEPFVNLSWDKFELFAALVAQANPRTRILTYSRGSWSDESARVKWIASMEQRFPPMKGRIEALRVNLQRPTFRNAETAGEIRKLVVALLGLNAAQK